MPSENVADSSPDSAAEATTWLLVRMWPSLSYTKPVPVPPSPSPPCASIVTTLGSAFAATPATVPAGRFRSLGVSEADTVVELPDEPLSLRSAAQ
ncbi:hypothetical protein SBADM41S_03049 [Streptomyces badius]